MEKETRYGDRHGGSTAHEDRAPKVDLSSRMHLGQRTAAPESEESYRRVHDDHEHVCFRTQDWWSRPSRRWWSERGGTAKKLKLKLCNSHATCLRTFRCLLCLVFSEAL